MLVVLITLTVVIGAYLLLQKKSTKQDSQQTPNTPDIPIPTVEVTSEFLEEKLVEVPKKTTKKRAIKTKKSPKK